MDNTDTQRQGLRRSAQRLPPEFVAADQRRRLTAAIAESCASGGFASVTVDDVVRRAAVSKRTFYQLFESKQECLLAAHDRAAARLLTAIDSGCDAEQSWSRRLRLAVRSALAALAKDPSATRLLTADIQSAGLEGMGRLRALIAALVDRLRAGAPSPLPLPKADWAAFAYMAIEVGEAALRSDPGAILGFEQEFTEMLLALSGEQPAGAS